ncbi:CDP-alcohol phosphatidyltransferase family protein [Natronoglycomyces albus]|uniref:CDP-alcohol phosphatidyltransferase family protein n=1 Tax=Natronoglycomyces albus TaxID=2811108 RepID=A0A895XKC1_9ACTN|nr:CDP-alcohol phosphatidyltransferase family protein [Natronoglycomyces albus]QSB05784.1 CDP-alcohol phosphatidyltransferase family protein [Natronoglycomyces albus]
MTTALILPGHLPGTHVQAQIRAAGVDQVRQIDPSTDDPWEAIVDAAITAADNNTGALYIATSDLVASDVTIGAVLADSSRRSGLLLGVDDAAAAPVTVDRGLVTGPGPGPWRSGALAKISLAHLKQLREHWNRDHPEGTDAFERIVATLWAAAIPVTAYRTPGLPHRRATSDAEAATTRETIDAIDLDAWRLDGAVKKDDDIFATYCVSSWSPLLVRAAAKLKLQPTLITWVSILFAAAAAGLYATMADSASPTIWFIVAGTLVYFSFVFDCVDGQLARYTQNFSSFGGWLDMIADRSKEYAIYAGLAAGATATGVDNAWLIALTAMVVQTIRHTIDTWYAVLLDTAVVQQAQRRESETDPATRSAALGSRLGAASNHIMSDRGSLLYWTKRTLVAGVGDRWIVLVVATIAFGPYIALCILLGWQLFALAYTSAWRFLRALAARTAAFARPDIAAHRDDGIAGGFPWSHAPGTYTLLGVATAALAVAMALYDQPYPALATAAIALVLGFGGSRAAHDGYFHWVIPAGLRAIEFGVISTAAFVAEVPYPALFLLLAVIALYFYDLAAGLDKAASPVTDRRWGLGWPQRAALILIPALVDSVWNTSITTWAVMALATYVAVVFIGNAVRGMLAPSL